MYRVVKYFSTAIAERLTCSSMFTSYLFSIVSNRSVLMPLSFHWYASAGLFVSSHSKPNRIRKKVVTSLRRRVGPGYFQAARDHVTAFVRAEAALPAETLFLDAGSFGVWPHAFRIAGAVGFAEATATRNQRNGFFVIHLPYGRMSLGYPARQRSGPSCRSGLQD